MSQPPANAPSGSEVASAGSAPALTLDRRKSVIAGIVAVAFLVIVFAKVIPQIGSYSAAMESLSTMRPVDLVLLGGAVLIYLVVYGFPFMASVPGLKYSQAQVVNHSDSACSTPSSRLTAPRPPPRLLESPPQACGASSSPWASR